MAVGGAGRILIEIVSDAKGFTKGTGEAERSLGKFEGTLGKIGKAVGGAFAAGAVLNFGKQAVNAASNLAETQSKVGVIFGTSADAVLKFGESAAETMGQSERQALDAASTFATFGKSAGLAGQSLVDFSTDFAGLASDLASFNNTSPEDAIMAIGAALRGESEPIRKYGVLLDDATLRQAALKLGIIETTKQALTPQQKVLAAQAEIWRQTTDAQGDFARTADGVANKTRTMQAKFENMQAALGEKLLPIMSQLLDLTIEVTDAFSGMIGPLAKVAGILVDIAKYTSPVYWAFRTVNSAMNSSGEALEMLQGRFWEWGDTVANLPHLTEEQLGNPQGIIAAEEGFKRLVGAGDGWYATTSKLVGGMETLTEATRDVNVQIQGSKIAAKGAASSIGGLAGAVARLEREADALDQQWDILTGAIDDQQAWLNLQDRFDELAEAAKRSADASVKGGAEAEQAYRDLAKEILETKSELIEYGRETLGLDKEVVTAIVAKLDYLTLQEVEDQMRILTRNRDIQVDVRYGGDGSKGSGDYRPGGGAGSDRDPTPRISARGRIVRATGGGQHILAGEAGQDEAVIPLGDGNRVAVGGAGGQSVVINLNVAVAPGGNPIDAGRQIVDVLDTYFRSGGSSTFIRTSNRN